MRATVAAHAARPKYAVALPGKPWLASGQADPERAGNDNRGAIDDRTTDAQRRLENHLSAVPVHAGEFCGQDRGRFGRGADHDRTQARSGIVRSAWFLVLPAVF